MNFASPIGRVLSALENPKSAGEKKWKARCPAHEDRNPSLSIFVDDAGAVGLKCHAGCSTQDVLAALRLEIRDLFPGSEKPMMTRPTKGRAGIVSDGFHKSVAYASGSSNAFCRARQ